MTFSPTWKTTLTSSYFFLTLGRPVGKGSEPMHVQCNKGPKPGQLGSAPQGLAVCLEGLHTGVHLRLAVVEVGGDAQTVGLVAHVHALLGQEGARPGRLRDLHERLPRAVLASRREHLEPRAPQAEGEVHVEGEHPLRDRLDAERAQVVHRATSWAVRPS